MGLKSDLVYAGVIFLLLLALFSIPDVNQFPDSSFSMLLSESIVYHRTFRLDPYLEKSQVDIDNSHQLIQGPDGHLYYFYSPGTSIFSIPFVWAANLIGYRAIADGAYDEWQEARINRFAAIMVMLLFCQILYLAARLLLNPRMSFLATLSIALGTQVWSTCTRGIWSHNWACLWLLVALLLVLAAETGKFKRHPSLLGLCLGLMFWSRPTMSIFIIAILLYVVFRYRFKDTIRVCVPALLLLLLFIFYSLSCFDTFLPPYYRGDRLFKFDLFLHHLAGLLVSPSRGLLVYVPLWIWIIAAGGCLLRKIRYPGVFWLAFCAATLNLLALGLWPDWHGGYSYGARLLADSVPAAAIMLIILFDALRLCDRKSTGKVMSVSAIILIGLSIFMNGLGAISRKTWDWNRIPDNFTRNPARLWDFRDAQFLRAFRSPIGTDRHNHNPKKQDDCHK